MLTTGVFPVHTATQILPICLKKFLNFEFFKSFHMIQRKQSVYLLLVTVFMSFLLISPYAELVFKDGSSMIFNSLSIKIHPVSGNQETYRTTLPLLLLIVMTGMLSFINIFFYNHRIWQIRICIISCLLLFIILAIMFVYYTGARNKFPNIHHYFKMAGVFPIVGFIMNFLAYRAIHQDEMLVNSYNRLR